MLTYSAQTDENGVVNAWSKNMICLDMQGQGKDKQIEIEAIARAGGPKAIKKAQKEAEKKAAAMGGGSALSVGLNDDSTILSASVEKGRVDV